MLSALKKKVKKFFLNRGVQVDRLHPARLSVSIARKFGYALYPLHPKFPVDPPIIGRDLLILSDPEFQRSVRMVREHTLLDVARLANLWNLARQTGPGTMLEVGTFRGGGALHIANSTPERELFVFDTFQGFRQLTPGLDDIFGKEFPGHNRGARGTIQVRREEANIVAASPESAKSFNLA